MENPYQSPAEMADAARATDPSRRRGLAHHVRALAILMIVQGALELLAAVGLAVMGVCMSVVFQQMQDQPGMPVQPAIPGQLGMWMMLLVYGGMAVAALASGALHLVAGIRNYRFRGRGLGIAALVCGALTVFTCYCLPTAVALGVYGLIVYLNYETAEAFRLGEAGCEPAEILASLLARELE